MKLLIVCCFLLIGLMSFCQVDSIDLALSLEDTELVDTDFDEKINTSYGLMGGLLFIAVLALILIGAGFALALIAMVLLFILAATGLVSMSVFVGLYKQSFVKGFKVFCMSSSIVGGLASGILLFPMLNGITHWCSLEKSLWIGGLGGLFAGLIFGLMAAAIIRSLAELFYGRIEDQKS